MEANQDIIFTGGLNSDDSLEFMPQGDYLDLENAENFDDNTDNKPWCGVSITHHYIADSKKCHTDHEHLF